MAPLTKHEAGLVALLCFNPLDAGTLSAMTEAPNCPRVCIVGSINMDLVVRAPRLPRPGETILGGAFATHPGGKGANQAVAAARMGAAVTMIGRVGADDHGRALRGVLAAEGIDVSRVAETSGVATGVALITVAGRGEGSTNHARGAAAMDRESVETGVVGGTAVAGAGENTIVVASGANGLVNPADVDAAREAIMAADVLLLQMETPFETVTRAAEMGKDVGTTVMLNAAPARRLPIELMTLVDVLIVNEGEASVVAAGAGLDEESLLEALADLGVGTVAMTLGARGLRFSHQKQPGAVEAYAVSPVDTVGAGDAFCGALATRWAEHQAAGALDAMGVMDALCWASAAGAIATTREGAIPSLPTRGEVVGLLRTAGRIG